MKKLLTVVIVLGLAAVLGWQIYIRLNQPVQTKARRSRPPVTVETAEVTTGLIRRIVTYTGSLRPSAQFVVAPRIPGRLKKLLVNIGDTVERNQVVVEIIDQEYRLKVEQAKAAVAVARARLAEARSNHVLAKAESGRARSLGSKKIIPQSELDAKEAQLHSSAAKLAVARAELEARQAALKEARVRLSYTRIQASWRGGSDTRVVGERFVDEGSLLTANAPIATILELRPIVGVIHVIERDYPKVKLGQPVAITADALPGRVFEGRIVRLAPLLRESSRQAQVELEVPNPDLELKPGMFIRAAIEFSRSEYATLVPLAALANRRGERGVFRLADDGRTVSFIPLKLGIVEGDRYEVLSPELTGRVVTLGHHLLEDGARVRLAGSGDPAKDGKKQ